MVAAPVELNGASLLLDPSGALFWREHGLLAVADLHLEKGSAFARRGTLLPPYDTQATLDELTRAVRRWQPRMVLCLGDSFHDTGGPGRLGAGDRGRLAALTRGRDWVWVAGNHDPVIPEDVGGRVVPEVALGRIIFRHEAVPGTRGEVSGHFHPKASVATRARRISGRCFVSDGERMVLPAFGAYAGGLDVLDPAIATLMRRRFVAFLLGRNQLFAFPKDQLLRQAA
ncbi:putative phosphoesterase [Stella humosa]|uniref:Putative phosphoesterase n=1 Tax=Stella humosa TaxID=94 RepID=A0A3N1KST7_9PROT|nr:ligase-associated DNA damage response endonuclease PdeM [Stella humosa]ROP83651.1 putative phosphoesterase [Stella humosa]BBK33076.1 metallophosphatase [Stella humosa]